MPPVRGSAAAVASRASSRYGQCPVEGAASKTLSLLAVGRALAAALFAALRSAALAIPAPQRLRLPLGLREAIERLLLKALAIAAG